MVCLRKWLRENDVKGLSISQMAAHLVVQIKKSNNNMSRYMNRMLAEPDPGERKERQRSILPLPCLVDSRESVKEVWSSEEFRRLAGTWSKKKGMSSSKIHREMRRMGLLVWHFLVVGALNFLWEGSKPSGRVCLATPSKSQQLALDRLWNAVKVFMDDTSESSEKILKCPGYESWPEKIEGFRVSYTGEVVCKAQQLTLAQILPGLPPEGYGGCVNLVDLCDGVIRDRVLDPALSFLEDEALPVSIPQPQVMANDEEWDKICGVLYSRGLIRPVEEMAKVDETLIQNGAFGVPKPGKCLENGQEILRFIMDFRSINSVMRIIEGDVKTLAGAPSLQHVVLPSGTVLRISAEDMVAAFYLFALPPIWSTYMAFSKSVSWKALGVSREGKTRVDACVLPMGWSSAVGLMQHAHRRIALRARISGGASLIPGLEIRRDSIFPPLECDGGAAWALYLDDTTTLEILDEKVTKEVDGKPPAEQEAIRAAYTHWGIPFSKEKALERASKAEKLGAVLDGNLGQLRGSTKRALDSMSLAATLCQKEYPLKKAVQVFAGKEVHTLQFRRPLFCIFDEIWKEIGREGNQCRMTSKVVSEILMSCCLQPMKFTDLRAGLSEVVSASDASETGGGLVYANRLSTKGLVEAVAIEAEVDEFKEEGMETDEKQKVIVFDFFAGIGGLSRALELACLEVHTLIVIEKDADCRRLHRRRWPGCKLVLDIRALDKERIRGMMDDIEGLSGVIAGGGSPCQGLSKLSVFREGLLDPRSALFYLLVERLEWIREIAVEKKIWSLRFCENVVGDEDNIQEMSRKLKMAPVEVCSSDHSWVRRPRLYWGSHEIDDRPEIRREVGQSREKLRFEQEPEPLEAILASGWGWPGSEMDKDIRLPTFTRAIPRAKPPPRPAGYDRCDDRTLRRWRENKMMFPPYTYLPQYLFREIGTTWNRVANADEREALMGYRKGYTKALFKKSPTTIAELEAQEVARMAAIGNAFHAVTMGILLDLWLWSGKVRTDLLGPKAICNAWKEELKSQREMELQEEDGPMGKVSTEESEGEELALLAEGRMLKPEWIKPSAEMMEMDRVKELSQQMVHHFLRRAEYRGSDVRLDVGLIYKPDAAPRTSVDPTRWVWTVGDAYPFKSPEHINILELRAILHALQWRARSSLTHSKRFLHLSDSQICLAVLSKGRSSSKRINHVLRRICALCLVMNWYPLWAWVESRLNPADEPSRRFEGKDANKSPA